MMDGWMDGWMNQWMVDGWNDEWVDVKSFTWPGLRARVGGGVEEVL